MLAVEVILLLGITAEVDVVGTAGGAVTEGESFNTKEEFSCWMTLTSWSRCGLLLIDCKSEGNKADIAGARAGAAVGVDWIKEALKDLSKYIFYELMNKSKSQQVPETNRRRRTPLLAARELASLSSVSDVIVTKSFSSSSYLKVGNCIPNNCLAIWTNSLNSGALSIIILH